MTSRDIRTILAGIFLIGLGLISNYLIRIDADKWAEVATIGAVLAALYIGLDTLIATDASLLYRINRWWISSKSYRWGALFFVVGCIVLELYLITRLMG